MRLPKLMSGSQAKLVGAALATVGCYAYERYTHFILTAEVGGAIAVLMVAFVDILFAAGDPTDVPAAVVVAPQATTVHQEVTEK